MRKAMVLTLCMVFGVTMFTGCGKKEMEQDLVNTSEMKEVLDQKEEPKGSSQSDAILLTLGEKVTGTAQEGSGIWYSRNSWNL